MKKVSLYILVASLPLLAQIPQINQFPSREFGQKQLLQVPTSVAPNLVEGRELNAPGSVAIDTSVSPPILYIADTFNNRVLAFVNPDSLTRCVSNVATCGQASKVIGQQDASSTRAEGPNTTLSAGLTLPTSVTLDSSGNLYVADSGNNRILRFPAPFKQTSALLAADLVIGQQSLTSDNRPNQGNNLPSARTLALLQNGNVFRSGMALEPGTAGNLWVSDPGNNRVLRFSGSQLKAGTIQPVADIVLGQADFVSNQVLPTPQGINNAQLYKNSLVQPSGLVFDSSGALYVADALARVLYYVGPFVNGLAARRILGVNQVPAQGQQPVPYPNQFTLGMPDVNGNCCFPPEGVLTNGTNVLVVDSPAHRIVVYDVPANWPAETATQPSPPILAGVPVIGQNDAVSGKANKGQGQPDNTSLNTPVSGAFLGSELWVADSGNHRVLAFPAGGPLSYTGASRLVGQLDFPYNATNLIEGREVYFANISVGIGGSAGMVVDTSSSPPHLYVADTFNNRILGFRDARKVSQTSVADLVIGQPDVFHAVPNYPTADATQPSASNLLNPTGLAIDASGNLYVADSGNGRVLRFPTPFAQTSGQTANLVLGQANFTAKLRNPSPQNMGTPWGVALVIENNATVAMAVSDFAFNRVLIFKRSGSDFTNGQSASIVLGQQNFASTVPAQGNGTIPPSVAGMNSPRGIATDSSERLYVTDANNNRVLIFTSLQNQNNGGNSSYQINNLNFPQSVFVSSATSGNTGEIWVANTNSNVVHRFPEYVTLSLSTGDPVASVGLPSQPLAITLDASGNLIVAESANRVSFFFPQLTFQNPASYNQQPLAPGMLAILYRLGKDFNFTSVPTPLPPWGSVMGDMQLTVDGTPAPMARVDTIDLLVQIPSNARTSGNADFVLTRVSTGEVLAAASLAMAKQSPAFFTSNQKGTGDVAAFLKDGSVMTQANAVARGDYISFCLTGLGTVANQPPDGDIAHSEAPMPASNSIVIASNSGGDLTPGKLYSGLGCGFPGGWQLSVTIPQTVTPGQHTIAVSLNDTPSTIGPFGQISTTYWAK